MKRAAQRRHVRRGVWEMMDRTADVVVIGGGPAGSTVALRLLELGITPLIVEREAFPRYHIGESMTGECGAIVRDLGFGDQMNGAGHPVKNGVNVFGTRGNQDWWVPVMRRDEEGLHDQVTWQVRRSVFDSMLLNAAVKKGAQLVHGRATDPIVDDDGAITGIKVLTEGGREISIGADLTLDCSGQASFLANKHVTGPKYLGAYDKQIAVFSQVADYQRDDSPGERSKQPGNTHIFYTKKYHWAWAIPIDDEVTSIGIVIPAAYFREKKESRDDFVRREIHELNRGLADRVPKGDLVEPAHTIPNYSFQVRKFAGPGYMCIGDAHRFVDPIFSFGLYVAMREAGMAATAAARYLEGEGRDSDDPFHDHMVLAEKGIDVLEDVLDTFWENPLAFAYIVHSRHRGSLTDVFAGRIYDDMPQDPIFDSAMADFRRLLGRERLYDEEGLYSVPIGSRFHPERAPLWNSTLSTVETTEAWLREAG
jgi:flavin-dependent dehydrogenase